MNNFEEKKRDYKCKSVLIKRLYKA